MLLAINVTLLNVKFMPSTLWPPPPIFPNHSLYYPILNHLSNSLGPPLIYHYSIVPHPLMLSSPYLPSLNSMIKFYNCSLTYTFDSSASLQIYHTYLEDQSLGYNLTLCLCQTSTLQLTVTGEKHTVLLNGLTLNSCWILKYALNTTYTYHNNRNITT